MKKKNIALIVEICILIPAFVIINSQTIPKTYEKSGIVIDVLKGAMSATVVFNNNDSFTFYDSDFIDSYELYKLCKVLRSDSERNVTIGYHIKGANWVLDYIR